MNSGQVRVIDVEMSGKAHNVLRLCTTFIFRL